MCEQIDVICAKGVTLAVIDETPEITLDMAGKLFLTLSEAEELHESLGEVLEKFNKKYRGGTDRRN